MQNGSWAHEGDVMSWNGIRCVDDNEILKILDTFKSEKYKWYYPVDEIVFKNKKDIALIKLVL
jgi:hypothetical protein